MHTQIMHKTHTHTYTHIHVRAHTHIHTYTCTHTHTHTRIRVCAHTHTCTHTHAHLHTHTHTYTRVCTHPCMMIKENACVSEWLNKRERECVHMEMFWTCLWYRFCVKSSVHAYVQLCSRSSVNLVCRASKETMPKISANRLIISYV